MKVGIIGSGMIANVFLNTFQNKSNIKVEGIWCLQKYYIDTNELASKFNVPIVETDLDSFLKHKEFDTIYIAVINSLHYENVLKSLKAGKNVICEKPFTTTYEKSKELYDLAKEKNLFLFDCIPSRYSENFKALQQAIYKIGELKIVNFAYSQYSRRYDKYLEGDVLPVFSVELAGGALYDLNVYNLSLIVDLFGEPIEYKYYFNKGFNGIDVSGAIMMDYGSFKVMSYTAKDCDGQRQGFIQGTKGFICIDDMPSNVANMYLKLNGQDKEKIDIVEYDDVRKHMFLQMDKMLNNNERETAISMLEKTLITMKIMEKARKDAGLYFGVNND